MNQHLVPCPHCGGEIRADAVACRHCGSSDEDGWKEELWDDADDDADYEEFTREHFSPHVTNTNTRPLYRLAAVILLLIFALPLLLFVYSRR